MPEKNQPTKPQDQSSEELSTPTQGGKAESRSNEEQIRQDAEQATASTGTVPDTASDRQADTANPDPQEDAAPGLERGGGVIPGDTPPAADQMSGDQGHEE